VVSVEFQAGGDDVEQVTVVFAVVEATDVTVVDEIAVVDEIVVVDEIAVVDETDVDTAVEVLVSVVVGRIGVPTVVVS